MSEKMPPIVYTGKHILFWCADREQQILQEVCFKRFKNNKACRGCLGLKKGERLSHTFAQLQYANPDSPELKKEET